MSTAATRHRVEVPGGEDRRRHDRAAAIRSAPKRVVLAAAVALALALLAMALVVASRAAYGGNSDDATLVLQGQSMAHGNLTLSGWDLSYDAFWTSDVPFYALGVALVGVRPGLMNTVPAAVAVLLLLGAGALALAGLRRAYPPRNSPGEPAVRAAGDASRLAALGLVVAVLALPSPVLAYFLLQAGWHAVTALLCLAAFAGVTCSRRRVALVAGALALAAALLGDLLSVELGAVPLLAAGAVEAWRRRNLRSGARHAGAVGLALCVAGAARLAALAAGTYTIGSRSVLATGHQVAANLVSLPRRVAAMFGVGDIVPGRPASPWPLVAAHAVVLGVVLAGLVAAVASLVRGLARSATHHSRPPDPDTCQGDPSAGLDDVLVLASLASAAAYLVFATDGAIALSRYLVPGVVFAVVLAARRLGRWVDGLRAGLRRAALGIALVLVAASGADFAVATIGSQAPQGARSLAAFLASRHLHDGIGDYWSASIVTVDSSNDVRVRPVQLGPRHSLVRYTKQSAASWYDGVRFQFFVADASSPWQGVTAAAAARAFGAPRRTFAVGSYRVLVWSHDLRVAR